MGSPIQHHNPLLPLLEQRLPSETLGFACNDAECSQQQHTHKKQYRISRMEVCHVRVCYGLFSSHPIQGYRPQRVPDQDPLGWGFRGAFVLCALDYLSRCRPAVPSCNTTARSSDENAEQFRKLHNLKEKEVTLRIKQPNGGSAHWCFMYVAPENVAIRLPVAEAPGTFQFRTPSSTNQPSRWGQY